MVKTTQEADDEAMMLAVSGDKQWSRGAPWALWAKSGPGLVPGINCVFVTLLGGNTAELVSSLHSNEFPVGGWEALRGGWCINKVAPFPRV